MECLLCACQGEALQLNVLLQCVKVSVICFRIPSQVYYQSFIYVICFLFYAVPNCKHATSNFPFSSSFKPDLFSLECPQTHLDVLRCCRLHAPLGSDRFWSGELASLRFHEKGLQISMLDLGNAIPLFHWVSVGHRETEWWMYCDPLMLWMNIF